VQVVEHQQQARVALRELRGQIADALFDLFAADDLVEQIVTEPGCAARQCGRALVGGQCSGDLARVSDRVL
jgi:hypothetical protein